MFAAKAFACLSPSKRAVTRVMKEVADDPGNTPAVARSAYVDPLVDAFLEGRSIGTRGDPEKAVLRPLR